jgi:exodeoxyribonuclease V alpha subunit
MDGWNGRVCANPAANTFCVGNYSYPGDQIRVSRNLEWEKANAGAPCSSLDAIPPCVYSINAFGRDGVTGYSDPPEWYPAQERRTWEMPASTVCIWPFEEMYRDEVKRSGKGQPYDYDKRLAFAQEYRSRIDVGQSLVFYYANYSNPFSEDDARKYVLVGMSRVKELSKIRNYDNMLPEDRNRYGGGFVWALDLTSYYPDEGLRLPYHAYLERPEVVDSFIVIPPNPRLFKYATRQFSDDDALELVERLIESVGALRELRDTSEDWQVRLNWLNSVVAELWTGRGLFPGMPAILDYLHIAKAISFFKRAVEAGRERDATEAIFSLLEGGSGASAGLDPTEVKAAQRRWALLEDQERTLLRETMVRFEVTKEQIQRIIGPTRENHGITASISDIAANPYILSEQFIGDDADDTISFTKIDHGTIPSPDLGGEALADTDDWRRLRALCVDRLRGEQSGVFIAAEQLIHDINHRLSFYPEWKRHQFTERYLEVDRESLERALLLRSESKRTFRNRAFLAVQL